MIFPPAAQENRIGKKQVWSDVMTLDHARKRIDEILLQGQKVSEAEIAAALNRQKSVGGKLCSHLFESGAATEEDLILALSEHFGRPGVKLDSIEIDPDILNLVPPNFALSRLILPIDINPEQNAVRIACMDPDDAELSSELNTLVHPRSVELFVAVESTLRQAVDRFYASRAAAMAEQRAQSEKATVTGSEHPVSQGHDLSVDRKHVLLLSEDPTASQLLRVILERDGFVISEAGDADEALARCSETGFGTVLIQAEFDKHSSELANRIRSLSPNSRVNLFQSVSDLLVSDVRAAGSANRLQQKLELFASLLTINERAPQSQSMREAYFVDKLCRRLDMDESQRVLVMSAAHLHERAKFYYMTVAPRDFRRLVDLVIKLLQTVYYEPAVIDILRTMYMDLSLRAWRDPSFEITAGNILTITDMFSEAFQPNRRLTIDKIEEFERSLQPEVGKLVLPEVFSAFMAIVRDESMRPATVERQGQIMIYSESMERVQVLVERLKVQGLRTIIAPSWASLTRLCHRSIPDLLVLHVDSPVRTVFAQVKGLKDLHIDVEQTPTILLAPQYALTGLTPLLEWGIEDILDRESDPDHIALKISKSWKRIEARLGGNSADGRDQLASRGNLRDMNLIELLQILGISGRSSKIKVAQAGRPQGVLEIHVEMGQITFARLGELQGAEAIYAGMLWEEGNWTIEPITEHDVRDKNNQLPNEAILLEGCRLMDEMHAH
jgi:DNA-binding response OmpR family regulator